MEYFAKIIKLLNILAKHSILEVLKDSYCGSGMLCVCLLKARAPYSPVFFNTRNGFKLFTIIAKNSILDALHGQV